MAASEQVMERAIESPPRPELLRPNAAATPAAPAEAETAATFSPDPMRRTDRYRLVTPYLLRL